MLTWLESNVWEYLPDDMQVATRGKVLEVFNEFKDLATDMVASDTGVINDFWVEALDTLHDAIRRLDRAPVQDHQRNSG